MKHRIFYAGKAYGLDHATRYTHALMGRRADHVDRPDEVIAKSPKERTALETAQVARHSLSITHGYYAMGVLGWAESEEHAERLKERFPSPDWTDIAIVPVKSVSGDA